MYSYLVECTKQCTASALLLFLLFQCSRLTKLLLITFLGQTCPSSIKPMEDLEEKRTNQKDFFLQNWEATWFFFNQGRSLVSWVWQWYRPPFMVPAFQLIFMPWLPPPLPLPSSSSSSSSSLSLSLSLSLPLFSPPQVIWPPCFSVKFKRQPTKLELQCENGSNCRLQFLWMIPYVNVSLFEN